MRNKVRRRNSNGSAASVKQASDTVHPRKMRCSVDGSALSRNIEDMMKIIAAQGRVISEELNRMGGDCSATSSSQQPRNLAAIPSSTASRSCDAGLNRSTSSSAAMRSLERPRKRERSEPALIQRQATSSAEEQTDIEQVRNLKRVVEVLTERHHNVMLH